MCRTDGQVAGEQVFVSQRSSVRPFALRRCLTGVRTADQRLTGLRLRQRWVDVGDIPGNDARRASGANTGAAAVGGAQALSFGKVQQRALGRLPDRFLAGLSEPNLHGLAVLQIPNQTYVRARRVPEQRLPRAEKLIVEYAGPRRSAL